MRSEWADIIIHIHAMIGKLFWTEYHGTYFSMTSYNHVLSTRSTRSDTFYNNCQVQNHMSGLEWTPFYGSIKISMVCHISRCNF